MTFNLNDTASYKTYFEDIATRNKLLGADKFLFGDIEAGQSKAYDWQGAGLWVWPSTRATPNGEVDNFYLKREGSLFVCIPKPELRDDVETAYKSCEIIVKQIISKFLYDFTVSNSLSTQVGNWSISRYESTIGSTNFIGCELIFNWDDPDGFEYDEDNWL